MCENRWKLVLFLSWLIIYKNRSILNFSHSYPDFHEHCIRVIERSPKWRPQISTAHYTQVRIIFQKIRYDEDRFWDDVLPKWFNFLLFTKKILTLLIKVKNRLFLHNFSILKFPYSFFKTFLYFYFFSKLLQNMLKVYSKCF